MQIARFEAKTSVEGPGIRSAVWLQGCSLGCQNCCNPEMHDFSAGQTVSPDELAEMILRAEADGLSLLGGEPLDQADELLQMLKILKKDYKHGIFLFSGYTYENILADKKKKAVTEFCDLLIAGPFFPELQSGARRWIGSDNQTVHYISEFYSKELKIWPAGKKEIEIIFGDNDILINGTPLADDHELTRLIKPKMEAGIAKIHY